MKPNADALNAQAAVRPPVTAGELAQALWTGPPVGDDDPELSEAIFHFMAEGYGLDGAERAECLAKFRRRQAHRAAIRRLEAGPASDPAGETDLADGLWIIEWAAGRHFTGLLQFTGSAGSALERGIDRCGDALHRLRDAAWLRYGPKGEGMEGVAATAHDEARTASVYVYAPDPDAGWPFDTPEDLPEH